MKKILMTLTLIALTSLSHASNGTSQRTIEVLNSQRDNLVTLSYKARTGALKVIRSQVGSKASQEVNLHALDLLEEASLYYLSNSSMPAQNLIRDLAIEANDPEVTLKALSVLEKSVEFRWSGSAEERVNAAKCIIEIAHKFSQNEDIQNLAIDIFLGHIDSNVNQIHQMATKFVTEAE